MCCELSMTITQDKSLVITTQQTKTKYYSQHTANHTAIATSMSVLRIRFTADTTGSFTHHLRL